MIRALHRSVNRMIHRWAVRYMLSRHADFVIGEGYLYRWWVIPRNRVFNIYLHLVATSDDDRALHDHPWWNVSYIISGAYNEVLWDRERFLDAGDLAFRRANTAHRLEVIDGPVLTLFITGPRVREWGFWCPAGWRHWKVFTDPTDSGKRGRGCE